MLTTDAPSAPRAAQCRARAWVIMKVPVTFTLKTRLRGIRRQFAPPVTTATRPAELSGDPAELSGDPADPSQEKVPAKPGPPFWAVGPVRSGGCSEVYCRLSTNVTAGGQCDGWLAVTGRSLDD
jgi:hypothetical protein